MKLTYADINEIAGPGEADMLWNAGVIQPTGPWIGEATIFDCPDFEDLSQPAALEAVDSALSELLGE